MTSSDMGLVEAVVGELAHCSLLCEVGEGREARLSELQKLGTSTRVEGNGEAFEKAVGVRFAAWF